MEPVLVFETFSFSFRNRHP